MSEAKNGNGRLPNPDEIIKNLDMRGDGNSGDTKGNKLRRQIRQELDGMSKPERIQWLKEHFPEDAIWKELN